MRARSVRRLLAALLLVGVALLTRPTAAISDTPPHLGYGMMLAFPPEHLGLVREAGFDWFKYFVYWNAVDGDRDRIYNWETVDWRLDEACRHELHVLLRVERDSWDWTPIRDHELDGWEAFFHDLTAHIAARRATCAFPYRVALEVWNEPNLHFQWGYEPVDPARYTEMVKHAYRGAKAADPHMLIVAGSLAPTGGWPGWQAMDDVVFLQAMYAAGLKGHFDAISIHNYGFGGPPEDKAWGDGIHNFRRAEDIYAVMVAHGDGVKPVWATEFGWLLESASCNATWQQSGFAWQQVSAAQQADYLRRAFAYADANWPWMGPMIVSNLDFSVMPWSWYPPCDPLRYFAVLNSDKSPRPAYTALAAMDKRPRTWELWGMQLSTTSIVWLQAIDAASVVSRTVTVHNTGESPFGWSVTVASDGLPMTVAPTSGVAGEGFTVTADPRGLALGTYTATLTIAADASGVAESPIILPVRVTVAAQVHQVSLPLIQRR
jgi:hypothetical protein